MAGARSPITWYSAVLLEHARRPRHLGTLAAPDLARDGANPLCGDYLRIELALRDGVIIEAAFTASACAVTVAAASLLVERVLGARMEDAAAIADAELLRALDAEVPMARLRCALLPLVVLREALASYRPPL